MQGCDPTPNPRNILSKDDPSFTPGPLPPIPWPEDKGAGAAAPAENKEVVTIKTPKNDTPSS